METGVFVRDYLGKLHGLLDTLDTAFIDALTDAILTVWRKGGRVLFMGNGGSHATVSHIVNDMQKNVALASGRPLRTLCLSDCTPLLMSWANDTQWENVFAPQVECWAEPGDVVIGVSGSGNSANVINGIEAANRRGAHTFGLAGNDGGRLKAAAQQCLVVPDESIQRIEDVHMVALHLVFCAVLERAQAEAISA